MAINRRKQFQRKNEPQHRINEMIKAPQVRVVGEGIENQILPIAEALKLAEEKELDLVEIVPQANPPVCKIIDYSKFLYEQKKKQKEIKAKTVKVVVKEIRFGPHTDEHDFQFKLKHAIGFLKSGAKVKVYVFFKGRTIVFKDQGYELLQRFIQELEEYAVVESPPKMEGKKMITILAPKKQK